MKGYIKKIETLGLLDGPGIRTIIFLSGCKLRCKYCHNPEMWKQEGDEYTPEELTKKILRNKSYYKNNNGGVTFSGGEPLLQIDFLIETAKLLKKENIHITLDTAGCGNKKYKEILELIDLVILDIKYAEKEGYKDLTTQPIEESEEFIIELNISNKPVWIRQVIIPNLTDNEEYLKKLKDYIKNIKNIKKIEFLPFHHLGFSKYEELKITNPYKDLKEINDEKIKKLYTKFKSL